jgi:hypothetical protein
MGIGEEAKNNNSQKETQDVAQHNRPGQPSKKVSNRHAGGKKGAGKRFWE